MMSSGASSAPASTIMMALRVPATTMSMLLSSSCSNVGLTTYCAVDVADAHRADRPAERDVADAERGRRGDRAEHVRVVLAVGGQHGDDDLHVVAHALREERAQRAVGQARAEDGLRRRAAFAAEEVPGILPTAYMLLFEVDGQREEVDARAAAGAP